MDRGGGGWIWLGARPNLLCDCGDRRGLESWRGRAPWSGSGPAVIRRRRRDLGSAGRAPAVRLRSQGRCAVRPITPWASTS